MVVFVVKRYAVRETEKWRYAVRKAKIGRYTVRKGGGGCHPHSYPLTIKSQQGGYTCTFIDSPIRNVWSRLNLAPFLTIFRANLISSENIYL